MDRGAWKAAVHGVAEGRTWLSDFILTFYFHALEKEMATRSSVLAWRIPGTEEPGGLQSMGSHRVGHDWIDLAAVKGFTIANEAEVDIFLEFPSFFYYPVNVGNLISCSSAFSEPNLYIWKFSVHILLKPSLKDFEHYLAGVWNDYNYMVVWAFFGIALLWDWNENWPFPVLWPLLSFPNLLTYWVQHFNSIIF